MCRAVWTWIAFLLWRLENESAMDIVRDVTSPFVHGTKGLAGVLDDAEIDDIATAHC